MRRLKAAGFSYRAATTLIPFCATRASPPPSYLLDASVDELRLHNSDGPVFRPPLPSFLPFFQLQGLRFCFSALFFHPLLPSFLHTLGFKVLCSVSFFILHFLPFFPLQGLRFALFPSSASFLSLRSRVKVRWCYVLFSILCFIPFFKLQGLRFGLLCSFPMELLPLLSFQQSFFFWGNPKIMGGFIYLFIYLFMGLFLGC